MQAPYFLILNFHQLLRTDRLDGIAVIRIDTDIIPGPTSTFQRFHDSPPEPRECLDTPPSIIIILHALS
jgi:hypothetical protein